MNKPLRIGIDVRDLKIAQTGTRTYLEELCKVFKKMQGAEYRFFFFDTLLPVYTGENKLFKLVGHLRYQIWKQVILPIKAWLKGCDVIFCTDNVVPFIHLNYKTVPVFHDAFFFETPEHFNRMWLWLTINTAVKGAKRSPIVITPSNYAKKQISHYTQIPMEKLVVIYEGPKSLEVPNIYKSTIKGRYILHVGVMNKRKNIPALIYAFKRLKESGYEDLKLVLAGKAEPKKYSSDLEEIQKAIIESGLENEVIFTGYISDQELSGIYSSAFMYVFPSLNEGFGIPVLEAFKYQVPVLVANNTCLPEIGSDAVLTFDPFNIEDLTAKMKTVLDSPEKRIDLIEKGKHRLSEFSWEKTAQSLLKEFDRIR